MYLERVGVSGQTDSSMQGQGGFLFLCSTSSGNDVEDSKEVILNGWKIYCNKGPISAAEVIDK